MADIALSAHATAKGEINVVESRRQRTLDAAETITAGMIVHQNSAGKWEASDADVTAEADGAYGMIISSVVAGQTVTAIAEGVVDGFTLDALAFGARVALSNTVGRIDSGGSPTKARYVGQVIAKRGERAGQAPNKLLEIDMHRPNVALS